MFYEGKTLLESWWRQTARGERSERQTERRNLSGQSDAQVTARTNQPCRGLNTHTRTHTHTDLTHISALVVMALPAYTLIISGARYESVVYLWDKNNRKQSVIYFLKCSSGYLFFLYNNNMFCLSVSNNSWGKYFSLKMVKVRLSLRLCHTLPKLTPDGHTNMELWISHEDGPELGQQPKQQPKQVRCLQKATRWHPNHTRKYGRKLYWWFRMYPDST